jgi:hypothetical protein
MNDILNQRIQRWLRIFPNSNIIILTICHFLNAKLNVASSSYSLLLLLYVESN